MCGIVAGVAQRNIVPFLIEGLKRLEYRGYDSAGIALLDERQCLQRRRAVGKVAILEEAVGPEALTGQIGIAHTRWATHGRPSESNAHPHISGTDIALVHNGIIENYLPLRQKLSQAGYSFESETDTEIIAHLLDQQLSLKREGTFLSAVQQTVAQLSGAFAIVFLYRPDPQFLVAVRKGSPLVIGIGFGENFFASDHLALLPVAQQFIYMEEGDLAVISAGKVALYDRQGCAVHRTTHVSGLSEEVTSKGKYRHFMEKEIFEQPSAVCAAIKDRLCQSKLLQELDSDQSLERLAKVRRIQIVACGTSYHAGLVARHWLTSYLGIPCQVDIASEFRYSAPPVEPYTLFIGLSQSGETADTLEALRLAKLAGYFLTLTICNVPESAMVRESDLVLLTRAGPEIGVASTKAFTNQLTVLLLLMTLLGRLLRLPHRQDGRYKWNEAQEASCISELRGLPALLEEILNLKANIRKFATMFANKEHALFVARGVHYPIALEGALKLKELSYIHAEAYPAGELKHGPLALVDSDMPVVILVPSNALTDKLKSNIQEVSARGAQLILFSQEKLTVKENEDKTILLPKTSEWLSPIVFTLPLQLLAYYVALLKGTDIDQPRNLAKSVTVE